MLAVVPDDYDRAYVESPHLEHLRAHGEVRVYTEPPRDEAELLARLAPAPILIPIRERTPLTAARIAALSALRLISQPGSAGPVAFSNAVRLSALPHPRSVLTVI